MIQFQKNLSVTKEQADYLKRNSGKQTMKSMADELRISIWVVRNNLRLLGIVKEQHRVELQDVCFENSDGTFNVDRFGKFYQY